MEFIAGASKVLGRKSLMELAPKYQVSMSKRLHWRRLSEEREQYLVDMNTGFSQCKIGVNSSPCKHQYMLWVNKLSVAACKPLANFQQ
jgi:hypothetical protein